MSCLLHPIDLMTSWRLTSYLSSSLTGLCPASLTDLIEQYAQQYVIK